MCICVRMSEEEREGVAERLGDRERVVNQHIAEGWQERHRMWTFLSIQKLYKNSDTDCGIWEKSGQLLVLNVATVGICRPPAGHPWSLTPENDYSCMSTLSLCTESSLWGIWEAYPRKSCFDVEGNDIMESVVVVISHHRLPIKSWILLSLLPLSYHHGNSRNVMSKAL